MNLIASSLYASGFCLLAIAADASTVSLSSPDSTLGYATGRCSGDCLVSQSDGFNFTTSTAYNFNGRMYLHDDGGASSTQLWRTDGSRIDAQSITFSVGGNWFRTGPAPFVWPDPSQADPFDPDFMDWSMSGTEPTDDYFWISGYRGGQKVAKVAFSTFGGTYTFDDAFKNIEYLSFELSNLGAERYFFPNLDTPANTLWCMDYCVSALVDSMTYTLRMPPAPVPLPASGMALLAGLIGLGALWRRQQALVLRAGAK